MRRRIQRIRGGYTAAELEMAIKNDFAIDHEWKAASNECGVMRTGRARTTLRLTVSPEFPTWGEIIILPAMDFAIMLISGRLRRGFALESRRDHCSIHVVNDCYTNQLY